MTKVLIIGGGIAGPVAAVALKRAGVESVVYEAHAGPADGLGAFLTLAPNGLAALRTLDMLAPVRAASAFPTTRIEFVNGSGRRLGLVGDGSERLPAELQPLTIKRSALQRALAEAAIGQGARIEYGRRLTGYTETASGVAAGFADGSTAEGDVLIGADGIHSLVRRTMDPEAPRPGYTGLLGIGGTTPAPDIAPTPEGTNRMVFGGRAFFGYQTAPSGEVFWFANLGHSEMSREEIATRSDAEWKEHVLGLFSGDLADIRRILRSAEPAAFRPMGTYDLASLPRWHRGRVSLLGDAAHAVATSSGQGASLAIEGSLVLAKCLRDVPDVPQALAEYESLRRGRVEKIAAEGRRRSGQKLGSAHPVALLFRDMALRVVFALIARFGGKTWMHEYRIDFEERIGEYAGAER